MYYSVSAVLQPIMLENTPSAEGLKKSLQICYTQTGPLQRNMQRILSINFADQLNDLRRSDYWGEFCDAFSLATIFAVQMKVAIVELLRDL